MFDSWQWWVSQGFGLVTLVIIAISMQQKCKVRLMWFRVFAVCVALVGVSFLGALSAIIMVGAGVISNLVLLYLAYKPDAHKVIKFGSGFFVVMLVVVLNIIFWENYLSGMSIAVGILMFIACLPEKAATVRKLLIPAQVLIVTYWILLLAPIQAVVDIVVFVSAIVGIVRLDMKKSGNESALAMQDLKVD